MNKQTKAQLEGLYKRLEISSCLSQTTLEECAVRMKPSFNYKLQVGKTLLPYAHMLVKQIGAFTKDHPFAPFINVFLLDSLEREEWFIENSDGESWGSEGI